MSNETENDEFFEDLMSPQSTEVVKIEEIPPEGTSLEDDFQRAKNRLEIIAREMTEAAQDAADMAKQMSEPRGYDALSKVATAATTANKAVVELHKNRIEGKDGEKPSQHVTNHTTVLMTTAEMAQEIKRLANESLE